MEYQLGILQGEDPRPKAKARRARGENEGRRTNKNAYCRVLGEARKRGLVARVVKRKKRRRFGSRRDGGGESTSQKEGSRLATEVRLEQGEGIMPSNTVGNRKTTPQNTRVNLPAEASRGRPSARGRDPGVRTGKGGVTQHPACFRTAAFRGEGREASL